MKKIVGEKKWCYPHFLCVCPSVFRNCFFVGTVTVFSGSAYYAFRAPWWKTASPAALFSSVSVSRGGSGLSDCLCSGWIIWGRVCPYFCVTANQISFNVQYITRMTSFSYWAWSKIAPDGETTIGDSWRDRKGGVNRQSVPAPRSALTRSGSTRLGTLLPYRVCLETKRLGEEKL